MKLSYRYIGSVLLFVISVSVSAEAAAYSAKLSLKSKYLGGIGTTVDDSPVLQPYIEFGGNTGFYGYFWANLPLQENNPKRSFELEPSIGYRQRVADVDWTVSLTIFDMQAPKVLQYRQDVLSPYFKLSKGSFYTELRYYGADRANDGVLVGGGYSKGYINGLNLSASLVYVDAPYHFKPIAYAKVVMAKDFDNSDWQVAIELMDILYFKNSVDKRRDEFAIALSYSF